MDEVRLEVWKENRRRHENLCKSQGLPMFVPNYGQCPSCRRNVFDKETGDRYITACPHCHRSFCD